MSLQAATLMGDGAYSSPGPFAGHVTSNATPGGTVQPDAQHAFYGGTVPSHSPQAGINYIDQAVGGISTPRGDTRAAGFGFRGYRQRFQPFNGMYIGGSIIRANRNQGEVGLQKANLSQRMRAAGQTNLPAEGDVQAAWLSPALSNMLAIVRGGSK